MVAAGLVYVAEDALPLDSASGAFLPLHDRGATHGPEPGVLAASFGYLLPTVALAFAIGTRRAGGHLAPPSSSSMAAIESSSAQPCAHSHTQAGNSSEFSASRPVRIV